MFITQVVRTQNTFSLASPSSLEENPIFFFKKFTQQSEQYFPFAWDINLVSEIVLLITKRRAAQ
jgi:hypothetical protein